MYGGSTAEEPPEANLDRVLYVHFRQKSDIIINSDDGTDGREEIILQLDLNCRGRDKPWKILGSCQPSVTNQF